VTTTGYGDMVPTTVMGKLLGSAIMLAGLVILALPITLISSNFAEAYEAGASPLAPLPFPGGRRVCPRAGQQLSCGLDETAKLPRREEGRPDGRRWRQARVLTMALVRGTGRGTSMRCNMRQVAAGRADATWVRGRGVRAAAERHCLARPRQTRRLPADQPPPPKPQHARFHNKKGP